MKGRRKLKTTKWADIQRFREHAVSVLATSQNQLRFLRAAAERGADMEPVGVLAGFSQATDL